MDLEMYSSKSFLNTSFFKLSLVPVIVFENYLNVVEFIRVDF